MQMSYANAMIGLTNVICKHCALICYWQTPNYWPRCPFSMNANKTWCKSRFFIFDANAFHKDVNAKCPYDAHVSFQRCNFHDADVPLVHAMMQMSLVGMQWMRMPAWVCNECKCLFESMPWCECLLGSIRWMRMPLCGYAMTQMSHWEYAMMRMLWCKHDLFKNSLYFRPEASTTPKTKIFSKLDLLFMKSHLPFDLRPPKIGDHY